MGIGACLDSRQIRNQDLPVFIELMLLHWQYKCVMKEIRRSDIKASHEWHVCTFRLFF